MNFNLKLGIIAILYSAISYTVGITDVTPGAVLYLDASDNPDYENSAWTNLGTAGGKLQAVHSTPIREMGLVYISSLGINEIRPYYTSRAFMQTFGGLDGDNPKLYLTDWTLEILCKRNGGAFQGEQHQLVGFRNTQGEDTQGTMFRIDDDGELSLVIFTQGEFRIASATNIKLEEGEWTWITVVSTNADSVVVYENAVKVRTFKGIDFDHSLPITTISIGADRVQEARRSFNGSFSLVRVYDKALNAEQVFQNTGGIASVPLSFTSADLIREGSTFTAQLMVEEVTDLAGWRLGIDFDPELLSAVSVAEGGFLKQNGAPSHFVEGTIDNGAGRIFGVWAVSIGTASAGSGELLSVTFEAKTIGEGILQLHNATLGTSDARPIPFELTPHVIVVKSSIADWDINLDGTTDIVDLTLVAQNIDYPSNPRADINGDGRVDILDLILVAQHMGEGGNAAPGAWYDSDARESLVFSRTTVESLIVKAYAADDGSVAFRRGIANLERLLALMTPRTTALLPNYPNPFNPETWIPYELARDADVKIEIYDTRGILIRRLDLGHQTAGFYTDQSKAAYWDGRNAGVEPVASGSYYLRLATPSLDDLRRVQIVK